VQRLTKMIDFLLHATVTNGSLAAREAYSPNVGEVAFSDVRLGGVLRSSSRKDTHAGQTERRDEDRGLAIRFRLEGEASGGSVAVFEFDVPAGDRVPGAHSHDAYEETIYGLGGVLSWSLYVQQTDVGPGEVVCLPRGVVHRFDNDREVDAKMLAIIPPASSALRTSARWPPSSRQQPTARPTPQRSAK